MKDDNPLLVQYAPPQNRSSKPPLVLVHDGGGTTFAYFSLGNLDREVWAIHNPNYFTSAKWEGGLDEMARHYIKLLQEKGLKDRIILGGWSLGGYLSMAMANILAKDPSPPFSVAGLLMVDSPYHIPWSQIDDNGVEAEHGPVPDLVMKSFENSDEMLEHWALPSWKSSLNSGRPMRFTAKGKTYTLDGTQVLHCNTSGERKVVKTKRFTETQAPYENTMSPTESALASLNLSDDTPSTTTDSRSTSEKGSPSPSNRSSFEDNSDANSVTSSAPTSVGSEAGDEDADSAVAPPPGVLVRCVKYAPTKGDTDLPYHIDTHRHDTTLGWAEHYPGFFKAVIDTDSHHFDVFEMRKVQAVTKNIKDGLDILATMGPADAL